MSLNVDRRQKRICYMLYFSQTWLKLSDVFFPLKRKTSQPIEIFSFIVISTYTQIHRRLRFCIQLTLLFKATYNKCIQPESWARKVLQIKTAFILETRCQSDVIYSSTDIRLPSAEVLWDPSASHQPPLTPRPHRHQPCYQVDSCLWERHVTPERPTEIKLSQVWTRVFLLNVPSCVYVAFVPAQNLFY